MSGEAGYASRVAALMMVTMERMDWMLSHHFSLFRSVGCLVASGRRDQATWQLSRHFRRASSLERQPQHFDFHPLDHLLHPHPHHLVHRCCKMADEVNIDKAVFAERLGKIVNTWKAQDDANDAVQTLRVVDSMLILLGTQSEEVAYQKTASLHVSGRASAVTQSRRVTK